MRGLSTEGVCGAFVPDAGLPGAPGAGTVCAGAGAADDGGTAAGEDGACALGAWMLGAWEAEGVADADVEVEADGDGDGVLSPACDESPIAAATIPPAATTPAALKTMVRVRVTTGQFCRIRDRTGHAMREPSHVSTVQPSAEEPESTTIPVFASVRAATKSAPRFAA